MLTSSLFVVKKDKFAGGIQGDLVYVQIFNILSFVFLGGHWKQSAAVEEANGLCPWLRWQ